MPTPLNTPAVIVEEFARNGSKNTIPQAYPGTGFASLNIGFPPETMLPIASGGVPPKGLDFNGIFNLLSQHVAWVNSGGGYKFSSTLVAFTGGYQQGMVVQSNDGLSEYISLVNNNTTDFNATPSSIGTSWAPFAGYATEQVYAGNPNGNVAGVAGTPGSYSAQTIWDTTNKILWVCTTTGNAASAVWTQIGSTGTWPFWCGTSTGSANAQTVTPPSAMQSFPQGTSISFKAGFTNTGATTITVGSFGTFNARKDSPTGPIPLTGGEIVAGNIITMVYDGTNIQLLDSALGTASLANASSATGVVSAVTGSGAITSGHVPKFTDAQGTIGDGFATSAASGVVPLMSGSSTVGHLPKFSDTAGTIMDGVAVSATTGTVAAVTSAGSIIPGHIAIFTDANGTVQDGGPYLAPQGNYINANGTVFPGVYLVDTSAGPITLTLSASAIAGSAWEFIDASGTFTPNNLTVALGSYTFTPPFATASVAGPIIANVPGEIFTLWFNGTTLQAI